MAEAGRILIVEDAPQVSGILSSKLTREGHRVSCRRTRAEALSCLAEAWDLVLLSSDLEPKSDAWELLGELRSRGARVVMLLETEESSLEPRALEAGALGVILKPFKPTVVARRVRDLLGHCGLTS